MLHANKVVPGTLTRSRTALALIAATLLVGGTVSEASAKSRHHRHHSHHAKAQFSRNRQLAQRQRLDRLSEHRPQFRGKGLLLRQ